MPGSASSSIRRTPRQRSHDLDRAEGAGAAGAAAPFRSGRRAWRGELAAFAAACCRLSGRDDAGMRRSLPAALDARCRDRRAGARCRASSSTPSSSRPRSTGNRRRPAANGRTARRWKTSMPRPGRPFPAPAGRRHAQLFHRTEPQARAGRPARFRHAIAPVRSCMPPTIFGDAVAGGAALHHALGARDLWRQALPHRPLDDRHAAEPLWQRDQGQSARRASPWPIAIRATTRCSLPPGRSATRRGGAGRAGATGA